MSSKKSLVTVELTFNESGILCNTLMQAINMSGGLSKVPAYILNLYQNWPMRTTRPENLKENHEI